MKYDPKRDCLEFHVQMRGYTDAYAISRSSAGRIVEGWVAVPSDQLREVDEKLRVAERDLERTAGDLKSQGVLLKQSEDARAGLRKENAALKEQLDLAEARRGVALEGLEAAKAKTVTEADLIFAAASRFIARAFGRPGNNPAGLFGAKALAKDAFVAAAHLRELTHPEQ